MNIPDPVFAALEAGAALSISISGGKDSQAMLTTLMRMHREYAWPGPVIAVHADLGRMDWPQSKSHCEYLCSQEKIEFIVVQRPQGDLLAQMKERMKKLDGTSKPFWPSPASRYCTSDQKRSQIDKVLRRWPLVISAEGMRAEESPARAKKKPLKVRSQITSQKISKLSPEEAWSRWNSDPDGRLAFTWLPIHDWKLPEVWSACGTSIEEVEYRRELYKSGREEEALDGAGIHPAYIFGNDRVSCVFCIMASLNDQRVGAQHNPELLDELAGMEQETGFSFQNGRWLSDLQDSKIAVDFPGFIQLPLISIDLTK